MRKVIINQFVLTALDLNLEAHVRSSGLECDVVYLFGSYPPGHSSPYCNDAVLRRPETGIEASS